MGAGREGWGPSPFLGTQSKKRPGGPLGLTRWPVSTPSFCLFQGSPKEGF